MNSVKTDNRIKPIIVTPPKFIEMPNFKEVWEARDLLFFLVERDLKTRFQQTLIGVFWIALQPIIQVLIFYLILGILVKVPTGDIPYPLFFLSGFVAWQLFSQIVNSSAFSMTSNIGVITKSYFPRLVLPLSSTIGSLIDFFVSFILLIILMGLNSYPITTRFFFIPILLLLTMIFSSGVGLLFGALMVSFRDVKNLLGFILMIWMYLTPIMYPISLVPPKYQILLSINPLTSLVESFRWVFLKTGSLPPMSHFLVSFIMMMVIWLLGAVYFRNMENKIADVM
ncbi:MAG: ABC transporter permease [Chloroflexi bacterium]|nr:ABC transporter permease [Chloroflexota bacterium]